MSGRGKPLSIKTEGYGRVKIIAPRPREGPACEKCRHLAVEPNLRGAKCTAGRDLEPIGCPAYSDASAERSYMPNFDYDGRFRR